MQEFKSALGLAPVDPQSCSVRAGVFVDGEMIYCAYKGTRDLLFFTTRRILLIDKQGITGKKQEYLSIPISRIQAFSYETAGTIDLDSEIKIYVSALGALRIRILRPTSQIDSAIAALNTMLLS
ncbi:PH domain-containing protein [Synechococcus elongatus]|uniref:PH domain-containing protein n=2 Tax=Synechococcus elongatus TaxID=32046 RepID=A0AAN1UTW2_SYNEL|nr:PH domain-containing protein [Synechococcus elongatus]AZB71918.1 hypothetical protein DOP62_03490 [Synechococcus elongatus PCC 11801]QFZ91589.1 hypothetical protein EKO22_03630 [Synechococcus elongatus PCC 11802]